MTNITDLYTPCLILDKAKTVTNIETMQARIKQHGVNLRPHAKTAKSVEIAKLFNGGKPCPITVSTLKEAEYFAEAGFTDIIYAVSMVPSKLQRVKNIMDKGCELKLIIDDVGSAQSISEFGTTHNTIFKILIEIDSDMHRAGLSPDAPEVTEIAKILHEGNGTEMMGVLTHAGESYNCKNEDEMIAMAEQERAAITLAADRIRKTGIECPIISCGSTPTATYAKDLTGVTEVRAGVFVFQDLFQAGIGSCTNNDISLSVLTTVISHKKNQNRILTDAGGMALSKDLSTSGWPFDSGYGLVCDENGNIIDNLYVESANQEHGMITARNGELDYEKFPIGTILRILPNHSCMTAGAYDKYNVTEDNKTVAAVWNRCNGW